MRADGGGGITISFKLQANPNPKGESWQPHPSRACITKRNARTAWVSEKNVTRCRTNRSGRNVLRVGVVGVRLILGSWRGDVMAIHVYKRRSVDA